MMKKTVSATGKSFSGKAILIRPATALAMILLLTLLTACAGGGTESSSTPPEKA
ncbi:MAG: hypothetical protein IJG15_08450 [Lachnospiraceae bacterium]|nr:hypothetical protein [Lachnospiraceae bacterium]